MTEQLWERRGINQPPHDGVIGIDGRTGVRARFDCRNVRRCRACLFEVASRAERFEHRRRTVELMLGLRPRAGAACELAQGETAERALISFANQLEDTRTLRNIVVRIREPARCCVDSAADSQKLAECTRSRTCV